MMKVHAFARENFAKVLKIRNEEGKLSGTFFTAPS